MKSIAQKSLDITGLFEAEVFVQLMLAHWDHPSAGDPSFASDLLEDASGILCASIQGERFLDRVQPDEMNFVAAVWCAENRVVEPGREDINNLPARKAWLSSVRHALPSCFCDPSDLI